MNKSAQRVDRPGFCQQTRSGRFFGGLLAVLLVSYCCTVYAADIDPDAANTGFGLLEEPVNPVNIGAGSAGSGAPGRGFSFYNPAQPFLNSSPYMSVDYGQYPAGDLKRGIFETSWMFEKWFFGASVRTASIDNIYHADEQGVNYNNTFSSQQTSISIDAGLPFMNRWSLGICLNGTQHRISEDFSYAFSVSGGFTAWIIPGKLSAGAAGFHLGTSTDFLDTTLESGTGWDLPMSARWGAAWSDTLKSLSYRGMLDIVYRHTDGRVMVPLGIEVNPLPQVSVRAGKRFNHDTEIINLGLGLNISPIFVDMSFVVPRLAEDAELKWLLGLTYKLGKKAEPDGKENKELVMPPDTVKPKPENVEE